MQKRFKALRDFKSREFAGTQYAEGMTYTVREGNEKLAGMVERWLSARLFTVKEDLELFGAQFPAGSTSYCIDDAFAEVVDGWVDAGRAEYVDGGLITFDFDDTSVGVIGG